MTTYYECPVCEGLAPAVTDHLIQCRRCDLRFEVGACAQLGCLVPAFRGAGDLDFRCYDGHFTHLSAEDDV